MDQEDPNQVKLTIFTFFMELSLAQINKMWFFLCWGFKSVKM